MLPTTFLPPRARRVLNERLRRRRVLDQTLAIARGIDPNDPACARFQGLGAQAALDRIARKRTASGCALDRVGALYEGLLRQ
jgi:hypothetical protein